VVRIGPGELHFNDHEFCLAHHRRADLKKCTNYYGLLGTLLGGLSSPHLHAERKSIIQPLFNGSTLSQFSSTTMNAYIQSLCDRLSSAAGASGGRDPVNITHYLFAYTSDVMVSYLVNEDMQYISSPGPQRVHDSLRAFSAIDLATMLRSMPPVKNMFDLFPALRKNSPLGWLDKVWSSPHWRRVVADQILTRETHTS
jgi:hypothetical protein